MYEKINFKNRIDDKPDTYLVDGEEVTIVKDNSGLKQKGTNLNAENLNHMEDGIYDLSLALKENATKETTLKDGIEHLTGGVDGILNINSIGGNTLYKRADGTYTDVWEENVELESVKDKVEVVSCGKNLFNKEQINLEMAWINQNTGSLSGSKEYLCTKDYILLRPSTNYNLGVNVNGTNPGYAIYDKDKQYIMGGKNGMFTTPSNAKYLRFTVNNNEKDIESIMLSYENLPYEPYKEDKTTIQLKEPLRSLPNGVKDTLKDGTLIRRVGKVVLDGNEEWVLQSVNNFGIANYYIDIINKKKYVISDKFPMQFSTIDNTTSEGMFIPQPARIFIRINKSKLTTSDVKGFKQWLSNNPTTVLYELAEPIIEKIESIKPLKCWQDGSLITNSNITPIVNFKYPTNLNSRLSSVEENTLSNSNFVEEQNAINLHFDFRITALENKEELV